jgi:hypothetical protein
MERSYIWAFLGLAVLIVVILKILSGILSGIRRRKLRAFASRKGWSFESKRDRKLKDRFPDFKWLRTGVRQQYAFNRMTGKADGRPFLAFDYHYQEHDSDSQGDRVVRRRCFSAVIVASELPLEPLMIRPSGPLDRVASILGPSRVEFESIEFNRKFFVGCNNRRWAYDVVHQQTMEFLLASPPNRVQFARGSVGIWSENVFAPHEFEQAIALGNDLLDRLPAFLKQQQAARRKA